MSETTEPREIPVVRVKLGGDQPAPQPDPLGRPRVGYAEGLTISQLWTRGRGVWKAKLTAVAQADLLVIVHEGVVRLVGTVDGVVFHGDRISVIGTPLKDHPLIGGPDPVPNKSQNPVAYGTVRFRGAGQTS